MRSGTLIALSTVFLAGTAMAGAGVEFEPGHLEDFEGYTTGAPPPLPWQTWQCAAVGEGVVSEDFANSGIKSHLHDTFAEGGSIDMVLYDTTPPLSGNWEISAWFFVPSSSFGSHFMILNQDYDVDCNGGDIRWAVQVQLNGDTGEIIDAHGEGGFRDPAPRLPLPRDTWFQVTVIVNLDANCHDILVDGDPWLEDADWNTPDGNGNGSPSIQNYDNFSTDAFRIYVDDIFVGPSATNPCGGAAICADTLNIVAGQVTSGDVSSTCGSDDVRLNARPLSLAAVFSPAPIRLEFVGDASPLGGATSFTFRMEATTTASGAGGVLGRIDLFNYTAGAYQIRGTFPNMPETDTVFEVVRTTDAGEYIQDGTGEIKSLIHFSRPAGVPPPWNIGIDAIEWEIE